MTEVRRYEIGICVRCDKHLEGPPGSDKCSCEPTDFPDSDRPTKTWERVTAVDHRDIEPLVAAAREVLHAASHSLSLESGAAMEATAHRNLRTALAPFSDQPSGER